MPLYEYQCKKCRHKFEKIQKFSDRPVKKCPQCGGPVEKVLSAPAVQFKGTGWYVTDYARKDSKHHESKSPDAKHAEAKPAESGSGKTESGDKKTEKKPAKK